MRKVHIIAAVALLVVLAGSVYVGFYFNLLPGYLVRPLPGASSKFAAVEQAVAALRVNDDAALSRVSTASLDSLRKGHDIRSFESAEAQYATNELVIKALIVGGDGERYRYTFNVALNRNILGRWLITSWHLSQ